MKHPHNQQRVRMSHRGAALLWTLLLFFSVSVGVLLASSNAVFSELTLYRALSTSKAAYVAAESGVEDAMYRLISGKMLPASEVLHLNGATSTLTVDTPSASERTIVAVGDAQDRYRKVQLSATKWVSAPFVYGAQVGEGGILMGNNATVDGSGLATGNIYANGPVIGGSGVLVTGDVTVGSSVTASQYASSTDCSADEDMGRVNPKYDFAQQFESPVTDELAKVSLYIKRTGSPGTGALKVVADVAGNPGTVALATQNFSYSLVATTYGWVNISFLSPTTLTAGTKYWIVFDSGASTNGGKYWTWCRSSASTYASGTPVYKANWSTAGAGVPVSGDLAFRTYFGNGVSIFDQVTAQGTVKADTITASNISGDAYYQTISGSSVGGTSHPGSPTAPLLPLPLSAATIATWKADAAEGVTYAGSCGVGGIASCNTFPLTLGPARINGNLVLDNNQTLTITGTVHVTGHISLSNNSRIRCAAAFGPHSCILLSDGYVNVENNGTFAGSGDAKSFVLVLTTLVGCNGAGSTASGCNTNLSGINVSNNVDGALFYSNDSMIDINNNAIVTAVVGYKLHLDNNGGIHFDNNVLLTDFAPSTDAGIPGWYIHEWREVP